MIKINSSNFLLIISFLVLLTYCKEDDSDLTPNPAASGSGQVNQQKTAQQIAEENLTGKQFYITDVFATINGATAVTFVTLNACFKDDSLLFKTNYTLIRDEGPNNCNPNDPQISMSSWSLAADSILTMVNNSNNDSTKVKILTNDGSTLEYEDNYRLDANGDGNLDEVHEIIEWTAR